jgi:hypothetical protein
VITYECNECDDDDDDIKKRRRKNYAKINKKEIKL